MKKLQLLYKTTYTIILVLSLCAFISLVVRCIEKYYDFNTSISLGSTKNQDIDVHKGPLFLKVGYQILI